MEVVLSGNSLTAAELEAVARHGAKVRLAPEASARISHSEAVLRKAVDGGARVYSVTTGVGALASVDLKPGQGAELQRHVLRSHSAGAGRPLPDEAVRAALAARANVLAKGYSGAREALAALMVEMLNRGVTPVVLEKGSLGASGDLAPLAQIALVLMGEGEAVYSGETLPGAEALRRAGLTPAELREKEALALINGTQVMTGTGALAVRDAERLLKAVQVAAAMTMEALGADRKPLDPRLHALRPFRGQVTVAGNLRALLDGSAAPVTTRVQDGYSIRCAPQVIGPLLEAAAAARRAVETELNSASDNPLVMPDGEMLTGGNFHGQGVALALDHMALAAAVAGSLCERHINRLLNPALSGLPPFLAKEGGLDSGFMVAHYTAAALASENKVLAHPASADSIPVSADQEDFVCMGGGAALKLRASVDNLAAIAGIHLLCAAQAMEYRDWKFGNGTAAALAAVRSVAPHLSDDRPLTGDIARAAASARDGPLVEAVEKAAGRMREVEP